MAKTDALLWELAGLGKIIHEIKHKVKHEGDADEVLHHGEVPVGAVPDVFFVVIFKLLSQIFPVVLEPPEVVHLIVQMLPGVEFVEGHLIILVCELLFIFLKVVKVSRTAL